MKKWIIVLLLSLMVGCSKKEINTSDNNLQNNEIKEYVYGESINEYLMDIDTDTYLEMIDSGSKYIVVVGSGSCSACKKYKPIVEKFSNEKKLKLYFVDLDNIDVNDRYKIYDISEINYLPTTQVFENGKVVFSNYGVKQYKFLEDLVKEYNIGE